MNMLMRVSCRHFAGSCFGFAVQGLISHIHVLAVSFVDEGEVTDGRLGEDGRTRTHWRDNISHLGWEFLRTPYEELKNTCNNVLIRQK